MSARQDHQGYLTGQFLIAMPTIPDGIFARSVVFMWEHTADIALGIVINKALPEITHEELFRELEASVPVLHDPVPLLIGGPVDNARGFVIHTDDYMEPDSVPVDPGLGVTTSIEIIKAIGDGAGPDRWLLALGYAGWSPGQLEEEIQSNSWLTCPADHELIFSRDLATKWTKAIAAVGIDASRLTDVSGHA